MHAPTRKSVACFGAVSLSSGKFVRSMCEKFDALTFETFLKKLLRHRVARQAHGRRAGQRQVPPCRPARALTSTVSRRAQLAVPAAVQPAIGAHRARLEAGPPDGDAQPFLRHIERTAHRDRAMLRPLAKIQFGTAQIMRHYLRRYV